MVRFSRRVMAMVGKLAERVSTGKSCRVYFKNVGCEKLRVYTSWICEPKASCAVTKRRVRRKNTDTKSRRTTNFIRRFCRREESNIYLYIEIRSPEGQPASYDASVGEK